jgi:hypothetical protein
LGPPIRDMIGGSGSLSTLDTVGSRLARLWPRLFAFNFLVSARRAEEFDDIHATTAETAVRSLERRDAEQSS